jgi:hypothetical protein
MKIFRIVLSVSLVAALFLLQGCDYFNIGGKVPLPFKWVEKGNRLTYDLNTPGRKIKGYRMIEIA